MDQSSTPQSVDIEDFLHTLHFFCNLILKVFVISDFNAKYFIEYCSNWAPKFQSKFLKQ